MSSTGSTLKLVSAATKAGITPEDMLENCRNNDVPCYVLTNIKVRRYSYKGHADKTFFFPQGGQRHQVEENFQINEFYRLTQADVDAILYGDNHTATIHEFIVKNFSQEKMPPKLIESIDEAPNIIADEPKTYGIKNLVLTHDGYAKLNTDEVFLLNITDYPKELKTAIKVHKKYWENIPENMSRPIDKIYVDEIMKTYGFPKKAAAARVWQVAKQEEAKSGGAIAGKMIPYKIGPHPKKK